MIAATLLPTTAWTHNLKVNIIEPSQNFNQNVQLQGQAIHLPRLLFHVAV